jgi:PilZ domain
MSLRPPEQGAGRPHHRIQLEMTSSAAAGELVACSGGLLRVGDGDRDDTAVVVREVCEHRVVASGPIADLRRFRPGRSLLVSWTELNDWGTLDGRVGEVTHDRLSIRCDWPPQREQRREFRRFAMDLPIWVCSGVLRPLVAEGRTRDLSGGGVAASVPSHACEPGDTVVAVIRSPERDVTAAATVQWVRSATALLGLEFEALAPSDQDHLVGLVSRAETRRGW